MTGMTHHGYFSGIGAFDLGLGPDYRTVFANDVDSDKIAIYRENHGRGALRPGDIAALTTADIPGRADLATAGFPCQDISEAGRGAGINGARSGVFWELIRLLGGLRDEGRTPKVVLIENVAALFNRGFTAVVGALHGCGYSKIGALVIDASDFTAQERKRVFIIGAHEDRELVGSGPSAHFTPPALRKAVAALPADLASCWVWWRLPVPPPCNAKLIDVLDDSVVWHDRRQTEALLGQLSAISRAEIDKAGATGVRTVFAAFRRTRPSGVQIEIRTDGRAGCLRVARGGSSRQLVIEISGDRRRTRYLSVRECARLMAIPDSFHLPTGYAGLNAVGDAVCVAAVSFLERHLLSPLIKNSRPTVLTTIDRDAGPALPEIEANKRMESDMDTITPTQLSVEEIAALTGTDKFADFPVKGPPLSGVVQPTSRDLDPASPKFVPGAQPGFISLRFNRDESRAVKTCDFTPFAVEQAFSVYEPTVGATPGAYIDTFSQRPSEARWQANANGKRQCLMPDGRVVKESKTVFMAVGGRIVAFSVHSSGLPPVLDMLDRCSRFSVKHPTEIKPLRGPLISKWRMTTTERREGSYRWWTPHPELLGKLGEPGGPSIAEVRFARRARANFQSGWSLWDEAPALEAPRTGRLVEVTTGRPSTAAPEAPPVDDDSAFAGVDPGDVEL